MAEGGDGPSFSSAADRIRDTAKWLIAAFAAVGAVLVAGTQLSSLGLLRAEDTRFWIALAGAVTALVAIVVAIASVTRILTVRPSSLRELATSTKRRTVKLRDILEADQTVVPEGTLRRTHDEFVAALKKRQSMARAWRSAQTEPNRVAAQVAQDHAEWISRSVQSILELAGFLEISRAFRRARLVVFVMTLLAAAGIVAFAAAANPPRTTDPVGVAVGKTVSIRLTTLGEDMVRARAGSACVQRTLQAVVLGVIGSGLDVLTLPGDTCPALRFTLQKEIGTVS